MRRSHKRILALNVADYEQAGHGEMMRAKLNAAAPRDRRCDNPHFD